MGDLTKMDDKQMDFLNELFDATGVVSDDQITFDDPAKDEPPKQDDPVVEPPIEPQKDEVPVTETVVETKEQTDDDLISTLRAEILALTELVQKDPLVQKPQTEVTTDENKVESKTESPKEFKTLAKFLSDDELDQIIDKPELINVAFERSQQVMLHNMQIAIQQEVNKQILVSRAISDFYQSNEDLRPYGKFVQFVLAEQEAKNPDKTYGEIFKETADECRKRLGLSKTVRTQQSDKPGQKPAFAGSKRGVSRPASTQEWFDPNAADIFNVKD